MTMNGSPAVVLDSRTHVVPSTATDDDYQLDVWLPDSYQGSTQSYPVLYVLDSPASFGFVVAAVMPYVWEQLVPELIVVGIGRPVETLDEWWQIRSRDYSPKALPGEEGSGHSDAFARALNDEILPFVDATYRTNPSDRTICGHSLRGVFVLQQLLSGSGLFHRFVATSPAVVLGGQTLLDLDVDGPPAGSRLPGRLFMSVGTLDDEFRIHIEAFTASLRLHNYQGLHVDTAELPGYRHVTAGVPGFLAGLPKAFPTPEA